MKEEKLDLIVQYNYNKMKKFEFDNVEKIMNLIPQKRNEGIIYIREEKKNFFSLLSDNGDLNYTMLNGISKHILDLCDGKKTVEEIVEILLKEYKGAERKRIEGDLAGTLFNFMRIRIINWKGENGMNNNPFLAQDEEDLKGGFTLSLCTENDIRILQKRFAKFFASAERLPDKVKYFFGNDKREFTNFITIRQFLYSYYKDFFVIKKNAEIEGVIVVHPAQEVFLNSAIIQLIDSPKEILMVAIKKVKEYYSNCSYKKVNTLRIYIPENDVEVEEKIKECGFKCEGIREKEYLEDINLKVYVL